MSIKNRKLQVFVSSTFTDLIAERQAAVEAILGTGNIPAGMELFAAGDQSQMEVIKEWIRESDVYLLILGSRYGSIEPTTGKSYTHLEYEYALEIGKPHFAVVVSNKGEKLKVKKQSTEVIERAYSEKYNLFKKQVTESKLVHFWDDLNGIELAIHKSLANFSKREELIGWVRGNQNIDSGALAEEMARLGKENAELRDKIEDLNKLNNNNFDILFSIFAKSMISTESMSACFPDIIFEDKEVDFIDANTALVLIQNKINGIDSINYSKEVLGDFTRFNLITLDVREVDESFFARTMTITKYYPRFSSEGVNYIFYLERNHPELSSIFSKVTFNGSIY